MQQDNTSKLRVQFDNGVVIRGSYRQDTKTRVAVELTVTHPEHGYLHTIRRNYSNLEGFTAVVYAMEELKQHLLSCNINKFKGEATIGIVKGILFSADKFSREGGAIAGIA